MVTSRIVEIFSILFIGYVLSSNLGEVLTSVGNAETFIPMMSLAALALLVVLYAFNRFVA